MTLVRRLHRLVSLIVLAAITLSSGGINAKPLWAAPNISLAREGDSAKILFRTTIAVTGRAEWEILSKQGMRVLKQGQNQATLLVDEGQLAILVRLGFRPRGTAELGSLLRRAGQDHAGLATSLQPMLDQATSSQKRILAAGSFVPGQAGAETYAALRTQVQALSTDQAAGIASLGSVDDDGDGLTNTEEAWWCTDPNSSNSDGDVQGYKDGDEVNALLDPTLPAATRWAYGPPFGPPNAWPNFNDRNGTHINICNDGDYDTIPDYAEAYMVGTRVPDENTDGDKFDDGEELFGVTFCPGGDQTCGYGLYPRTQDYTFITARMPGWVKSPGDSPFVAAYPAMQFEADASTVRVVAKEIKTIERTITQGEEIATGFAETEGHSTTVGTIDTNTHETWKENSTTTGGIAPAGTLTASRAEPEMKLAPSLVRSPAQDAVMAKGQGIDASSPSTQATESEITLLSGPAQVDQGVREAVGLALRNAPNALAVSNLFTIAALDERDQEWSLATVAALRDIKDSGSWNVEDNAAWFGLVVLHRQTDGAWMAAVEGTEDFTRILNQAPDAILSSQAKLGLDPASRSAPQSTYDFGYDFPWKPGTKMLYSQKPHPNDKFGWIAIDLASAGGTGYAPNEVRAARGGNIELLCGPDRLGQTWIKIDNLTYLHLVYNKDLHRNGEPRMTGDYLGALMVGPIAKASDLCGWSSQNPSTYHLHLGIESLPITFEGWELRTDGTWYQGTQRITEGQDILASGSDEHCCDAVDVTIGYASQPATGVSQNQRSSGWLEVIGKQFSNLLGKLTSKNTSWAPLQVTAAGIPGCASSTCADQVGKQSSTPANFSDTRSAGQCGGNSSAPFSGADGVGGGGSGMAINNNGDGTWDYLRTWSETTTNGEGWSTSHSELRTDTTYNEITRSRSNTLVSSEAWSTASTVDPTDAGQLTFNYSLHNRGTDYAVHLSNLKLNILIGDLPAVTWLAPDVSGIEPGKSKGPLSGGPIKLTLEQLAAIDNGAAIRVVLADYSYNDQLYDQDAWGKGVLFHVDDGIADGDRTVVTYLITAGLLPNETYQQVLARYFPAKTFDGGPNDARTGTLTNITTPEYDANGNITGWQEHPVNEHAWWELSISQGGETTGVAHFKDMPAKAKTDVFLRYIVDTDGDGYTDRAEEDGGTDPKDPQSHPRPVLIAARHTEVQGTTGTVQVALQNNGDFDASSVEIWALAADDSITVNSNLVGGGGRVRAGKRVVLGARIGAPNLAAWPSSTSKPYPGGQYQGSVAKTYTVRADASGTVGSTAGLTVSWSENGTTWTALNVGNGYSPLTPLALADGLTLAFTAGNLVAGERFTFQTALPIETFSFTVNRTPYTPPVLVVSYNDAQGNHKFATDVELAQIQDDLTAYQGQMRYGMQVDAFGAAPFQAGANTGYLVFNNPSDARIVGGKLFVEFAKPDGTVVKEYVLGDQTFEPGPNVVGLNWSTADFSPAYDPAAEYSVLVFAVDRQGTIIENTVKDLKQLGQDGLPQAELPGTVWDFGTAVQGEVLHHEVAVANSGQREMLAWVGAPGLSLSSQGTQEVRPGDVAKFGLTLDTTGLAAGAYAKTITIRTSDPAQPIQQVSVQGQISAAGPVARAVDGRPLDLDVVVPGGHSINDKVTFRQELAMDPASLQPVKVLSADGQKLWGMGKAATAFGQGTASSDMFGDGRDGVMPASGNLDNTKGFGVGSVNGAKDSTSVQIIDQYAVGRIQPGDMVLLHQSQGSGAGNWEVNWAASDVTGSGAFSLAKPLQNTYVTNGGAEKAQILRVPQYSTCNVSGTVTPLMAWNGTVGGIFAVACNAQLVVTGSINASATGYRGGAGRGVPTGGLNGESTDGIVGSGGNSGSAGTNGGGSGSGWERTSPNGWRSGGAGSGGFDHYNEGQADEGTGGGGGGGNGTAGGGGGGGGDGNGSAGWGGPSGSVAGGGNGGNESVTGNGTVNGGPGGQTAYGSTGTGGIAYGNANRGTGGGGGGSSVSLGPNQSLFGSGGGASGSYRGYHTGDYGGLNGGNGGGNVILFAQSVSVSGPIVSNGQDGWGSNGRAGGGGGGAGGSILLSVGAGDIGVGLVRATGGSGGGPWGAAGGGGNGGNGRIHVEVCESATGTTNPGTTPEKLQCYLVEQLLADPAQARLSLPETFTGGKTYKLQYGRQVTFTVAGELTSTLRVPAGSFSTVSLDMLVSGVPAGSLTAGLDIGGDGSYECQSTTTATGATTITCPDLTAGFNTYWSAHGAPHSGTLDVPVRVSLNQPGQVLLTDLQTDLVPSDVTVTGFTPSASSAVEGDSLALSASVANTGSEASGPFTAIFYATPAGGYPVYLGTRFVAGLAPGDTTQVDLPWDTAGYIGTVSLRVTADPYNAVLENDETNNSGSQDVEIHTRPDLRISGLVLSEDEPVAGKAVTVSVGLRNLGWATAGAQSVGLYAGYPGTGNLLSEAALSGLAGGGVVTATLPWTPAAAGPAKLYVRVDKNGQVSESNEGNNDLAQDVYVGFGAPVALDSGNPGSDPVYAAALGYGVVDTGIADVNVSCPGHTDNTLRQDPSNKVGYRFDHLQPGRFYHLDVVLYECDNAQRVEQVLVDDTLLPAGPFDLGDQQEHRLSMLVDPGRYRDHVVNVSIIGQAGSQRGAVAASVTLREVDYRYADSGGPGDAAYSPARGWGYLDGIAMPGGQNRPWETARVDQTNADVRYQFDRLDPARRYRVHLTFWQATGNPLLERIKVDGLDTATTVNLVAGTPISTTIRLSPAAYQNDGSVVVSAEVLNASTNATLNIVALEEETLVTESPCQVRETPSFSYAGGAVTVNGLPGPAGSVVTAENSKGDIVGCAVVETAGQYPFLAIFGEDSSANPPIPGMQDGELVTFRVDGAPAQAIPALYWHNDQAPHDVDLAAIPLQAQAILLAPDWNLMSFRMEPPVPLLETVLRPIQGRYCRVLSEQNIYICDLADFSNLKELHAGKGYYVRVDGGTSANLLVEGATVTPTTPIQIHPGWNWIGYLPSSSLPVTVALQSITGSYQRVVRGAQVYDVGYSGTMNTLKQMQPGQGYMLYARQAAMLVYPDTTSSAAAEPQAAEAAGCAVRVTPDFTILYGRLWMRGRPVAAGALVEAVNGDGAVVGCTRTETAGEYGMMVVFGGDETASPAIPGMRAGEAIRLRMNGVEVATAAAEVQWQDDKDVHRLDAGPRPDFPPRVYLPLVAE